jgi:DNA-binding response OmpR family regulator
LVIDDDKDYVEATAAVLEAGGYEALQAYTSKAGLDLARNRKPGLILLDVMMEERTSGYDLLEKLRADADATIAKVPVIIISSLYHEGPSYELDPAAGKMPADVFMAKPIEPARLIQEVGRLYGQPTGTVKPPAK